MRTQGEIRQTQLSSTSSKVLPLIFFFFFSFFAHRLHCSLSLWPLCSLMHPSSFFADMTLACQQHFDTVTSLWKLCVALIKMHFGCMRVAEDVWKAFYCDVVCFIGSNPAVNAKLPTDKVWLMTSLFAFLFSLCNLPLPHVEDLDDLRMEGVTVLALSGSKFSQGRSSYHPEPQAKVTLNICSRCAR